VDYIDIFLLVPATNIVLLANKTILNDEPQGAGMIFHVKPVANVVAVSIDW
jgi:hypothetical protein